MAVIEYTPEERAAAKAFQESPENQAWLKKQWAIMDKLVAEHEAQKTAGIQFFWTGWGQVDFSYNVGM